VILDRTAAHREAGAATSGMFGRSTQVPDGDQTNPTPRLRKAQALTALGAERRGDTLLAEIAHRA
jgi:hypothetical protein